VNQWEGGRQSSLSHNEDDGTKLRMHNKSMQKSGHSKKVGRNDPCPCGSGKKFKRCHGNPLNEQNALPVTPDVLKKKLDGINALEKQREKQQGLGRPIISTIHNGVRVVAVGDRIMQSRNWQTFHDFLFDYAKTVLGEAWGTGELQKPRELRHPILNWYHDATIYLNAFIKQPGKVHSAPKNASSDAYLSLAYNLYLLEHNAKTQEVLLHRLKNQDQFFGACYETFVASALIKAGFDIEFEDESDSTTSHCEFTAIFRETGKKFSVEAKMRGPNKSSVGVGKQLIKALKKRARHTRVVFIEVNVDDGADDLKTKSILEGVLASLRKWEAKLQIDGNPAPPAHVIVTNNPHVFTQQAATFRRWALGEGFKIPDAKVDSRFSSLRDAVKSREKHIEMFSLMKSLAEHDNVPVTFDGDSPAMAFGEHGARLQVGNFYAVPDSNGKDVVAELLDVVVMESKSTAYCFMKDAEGRNFLSACPLTSDELVGYKQHPETFFGAYKPHNRKAQDPIDLYDFFIMGYGKTPKERLLELMNNAPDLEKLKDLPQSELAMIFCERTVYDAMSMGCFQKPIGLPLGINPSVSTTPA
jgi:hypothetical protein